MVSDKFSVHLHCVRPSPAPLQDELAEAIQKLSSTPDPSTLQALQALISAQQQVLSLIAERGGGEELEGGGKETEHAGGEDGDPGSGIENDVG